MPCHTEYRPVMTLRPALPADCAALAALDAVCNPSPWSEQQFAAALASAAESVWLGEAEGLLAGFAVWQTVCGESELHLTAVAPAFRRRGFAAQLLAHWFQTALNEGVQRLFLEVREGNAAAQNLYRKHGFAACGRRKDYYTLPDGRREDAVLMEKTC